MLYRKKIKRLVDILIAILVLMFTSFIHLITIILIKLTTKGPVFYTQFRIGLNGKKFKIYKYRTMYNRERLPDREIFSGDSEVTFIGNYLRRYKIDELPQLVNILIGDMSLVGPRPCLVNQLDLLDHIGIKRLQVRPGLTGLAQTNGNIYLSWEERWVYDKEYVEKYNFVMDLKIIVKTILIVILGEKYFLKGKNV